MAEMTPEQTVLSIPPQWRGRMRKAIRAAVQAEREACAKVSEDRYDTNIKHVLETRRDGKYINAARYGYRAEECKAIAAVIRARGQKRDIQEESPGRDRGQGRT